ncbi:MAG: alpha/beta hydrolase [Chitinophagia bacterium]|nr:alpha/beta hydrolase [Chitinophagia bacterium]
MFTKTSEIDWQYYFITLLCTPTQLVLAKNNFSYDEAYCACGTEQLHYLVAGQGPHLLLAFPGFGQTADRLKPFVPYLEGQYTCVLVNLPHHGGSQWAPGTICKPDWLARMADELLARYNCTDMSLLGYSIGARLCLSLTERRGSLIRNLTLLAPDGININPYYSFFTGNFFGELLFRQAVQWPGLYFPMATWLKDMGVIDAGQLRHVQQNLGNTEVRKLLGLVWPALREILPSQAAVRHAVKENHIRMSVFTGKDDRLIAPESLAPFCHSIETCQFYIIDKGHKVFDQSNIEMIAQTLI